jgi:FGGY-family pentulose kinase/HAD superfamily hydrolase (TIGR01509 family)
MEPVELIIFDCDGVLVDSEPLAMRVLLQTIAAAGVEIDPAIGFRDFLGRSLAAVTAHLNAEHGLHLTAEALEQMRLELYDVFRKELRPTRWVAETLDGLDLPFCVASSSQPERIRLSLAVTGLIDRFEPRIFSASMVARGKPDPDLFLHAAQAMGMVPARCLVIEDSPAGIAAAKNAGMRVFAYVGGSHIPASGLRSEIEALQPDAVFDDMRALPGLVALRQERAAMGSGTLLVAVDVGTSSARAGVADPAGALLARAEHPISMHRTDANHAEYSSGEIWEAVCRAVRAAINAAGARPEEVAGISFDATCSLVVRDRKGAPISVSMGGGAGWDTIAWLDHRALEEAAECTASGHLVLGYFGGAMSPEMQVPKLLWLKRHLPQTWADAGYFFDLADFLTWTASGSPARSQSTLTCKWTYLNHLDQGWQADFLAGLGLEDMIARGALPEKASPVGADLGPLTPAAAAALGLTRRCRVGVGMVDAHAGTLGAIGACAADTARLDRHLSLIAGTSSSVMALSPEPRPITGVWGPYFGAVLPDAWLNEAGQSATGALLDHIIRWHGAGGEPTPARHLAVIDRIMALRAGEGLALASRLHVLPDFHGNRSPLGDPQALGVISGLTLDSDFDSLCRLYWRTAIAIALGLRHILDTLKAKGYATETLLVAGGHTRNRLLMELYADVTGCTVIEPATPDATLLGGAMVAATAAGLHGSLGEAAVAMHQGGRERCPDPASRPQFDQDYRTFLEMHRQRQALDRMS